MNAANRSKARARGADRLTMIRPRDDVGAATMLRAEDVNADVVVDGGGDEDGNVKLWWCGWCG